MTSAISLTNGREVLVDEEDFHEVSKWKWYAAHLGSHSTKLYAFRMNASRDGRRVIALHRWLLGDPKGCQIDHVNGNGLDCTRNNLRVCTNAQNKFNIGPRSHNRSGYKGIAPTKSGKWTAQISAYGNRVSLGTFPSREEAALAYNNAALEMHGEFARLNAL